MARELNVYPKAELIGSTWTFRVKIYEDATGIYSQFVHTVPAGVTVTGLRELKLAFDITVGDADTDQDVDDALFVDDIKPGPQTQTVIGNWIERAEVVIGTSDPTLAEYWASWSKQDTAKTRNDARKALVTQRGWTVTSIHQHEGDGTNTDESS